MVGLDTLRGEVSALVASTLAMPFRTRLAADSLDAASPHRTPVILVHGLFGSVTNFGALRRSLEADGIGRFASFGYGARIDYQALAPQLGELIASVCERTGAEEVDVVGHSLGGLIARYLVEHGDGRRVRRLVSLGSPWYGERVPRRELMVFGADDWLIPPPEPRRIRGGQAVLVPGCGHLNVLYHPEALQQVSGYLSAPPRTTRLAVTPNARIAA